MRLSFETLAQFLFSISCLITSQNDTTPKHCNARIWTSCSASLYQKAVKNGYIGTEKAFRRRAYRDIASSAVRKYGATGKDLSNYGKQNAAEFFAESFANANLGAPNAFGRAMQDYLKKNPLR